MDNNNWRAAQGQMAQGQVGGGEVSAVPNGATPAAMDAGDWRTQLQADHRQRIVNKIMDTLRRHLPFSGHEGLQELKKIAIRFEEKIYTAATSQSDYLRKISLKMLTLETKSQNPMASSLQPNAAITGPTPPDQAVHGMPSQIQNQQLSMPVVSSQSQPRQQLISQNIQTNMASTGVQSSPILTSAVPNAVNLTQTAMPNAIGPNPNLQNLQNVSSIAQNPVANLIGQGMPSNVFTNSQRLLQGRQQQQPLPQPPQQHAQNAQTFLYQQQLQTQQLMNQKFQQGGMAQSLMQQQQQQQQQNLIQPSQIQNSQQAVLQPSVMQSAPLSSVQQNHQSSVQQVTQPGLQQQSQSVLRQQQQQQQASLVHPQQTSISQQTLMQAPQQPQQQQQMIGQQSNATNVQHNQLIGQPNGISDVQPQQQRLLGQQSNIPNLQQQQLMGQQNSLTNMHQPQMGSQGNVSGLHQQSMLGTQSGNSGMPTNQHSMHMLQQSKVPVQQQMQQNAMAIVPSQNQLSQQQASQQQMVSHIQSQPVPLQHLPQQSSPLQREVQQRLPTSGSLLQQPNVVEQQKHLFQSQRANPEASSNSLDSTAQTGNVNGGDWQEEVYQKIKSMKDMYFLDLNDMLMKIATKLQQHDSLPQQPRNEPLEKLRYFKLMLDRLVLFLRSNKNDIQIIHKDKLAAVEKQIVNFLNSNRPRRLQQGQPSQPQMPSVQHSQPQSQICQMPPQDNQINSQMQPINIQSSMRTMQPNNLTNLLHSSFSSFPPVSSSQQNMMSSLQAASTLDMGQNNALNQQQQNQHIKQEQQTLPTQQLKEHMHPRHMMLARQQLMQQQQPQHLQQSQSQQHQQQQQVKQQHPSQLSSHQISPLHQMTDSGDLKVRQQMGVKSTFQDHPNGQRAPYHHQLKSGSPFPVLPPQVLQSHSPQVPPHPSPQIDQQNVVTSIAKAGTTLQSANSPYVAPSRFSATLEGPSSRLAYFLLFSSLIIFLFCCVFDGVSRLNLLNP